MKTIRIDDNIDKLLKKISLKTGKSKERLLDEWLRVGMKIKRIKISEG